ncbi:hypothetical protein QBC46DRAFT_367238 [Diplogelasinospora grovesii]|uniref:Nudix hydrolase domain-containing protein n=1 Tax=Diplogelasinospora grovesii TaxID=303347 RepID=A0AAN6S0H1_9PEZI|nr:hypothetical protein QBC46DRAFT_367238 [Diplogelasinospora grovesii]
MGRRLIRGLAIRPLPRKYILCRKGLNSSTPVTLKEVSLPHNSRVGPLDSATIITSCLVGRGIDYPDEDHHTAAQREMQEETGALIKLLRSGDGSCIATTEEYRHDLHQISYCYCADLPSLTADEISDRLRHSWMPVDEAKRVMAAAEPTSELGRYIKERDLYLLNVATFGGKEIRPEAQLPLPC